MPYARLDDRYDDHRKIRRALRTEPAAVAIHAMAITYCNRQNTDGVIEVDRVEEWLALTPYRPAQRGRVIAVLLDLRLFECRDEDTFIVHDFLDWNLSSAQRRALAEQGKRGGQARSGRRSPPDDGGSSPTGSRGSSEGLSHGSSRSDPVGSSTPRHATPTPSQNDNGNAELRSAVTECFAYWQDRCGHRQATLTDDRRGRIETRLRERARLGGGIPRAIRDVRQAIDGAAIAPFIDDKGKRFDDIELICRKGSKLEDFMGRASLPAATVTPIGRRENASDWLREIDAAGGVA